uniref:Uncharacterized protein n=1 Tax=Oryza rufipogon TaxID=4529 RepID=A0A0E0QQG3_ORYRU
MAIGSYLTHFLWEKVVIAYWATYEMGWPGFQASQYKKVGQVEIGLLKGVGHEPVIIMKVNCLMKRFIMKMKTQN